MDLHRGLTALAGKHGVEIVPTDTTYVESGTSLAVHETAYLKAPRVLLAWDTPTSSLSAADALHVGTPVRTVGDNCKYFVPGRANFSDFDVIVLPSGNYAGAINEGVLNRIKDWLRAGGTPITLRSDTLGDRH